MKKDGMKKEWKVTRRNFLVFVLALVINVSAGAETLTLHDLIKQAHDTSTALAFDKYPAMRELAATGQGSAATWLRENAAHASAGAVKRLQKGLAALAEDVGEKEWRKRVAELQAGLMELVRQSDELKGQWNLYWCPMVKRFWTQPGKEEMANAYMGTTMLDCGVQKKWTQLPKDVPGWP